MFKNTFDYGVEKKYFHRKRYFWDKKTFLFVLYHLLGNIFLYDKSIPNKLCVKTSVTQSPFIINNMVAN
jgi:hypothetical protein